MTNKYEIKAEKFLNDCGATFDIVFVRHGFHFEDDKEKRDIYCATFKKKYKNPSMIGNEFSIMFGDSIQNHTDRKKFTEAFNIIESKPSSYAILACLQKNEVGELEDFMLEFGYEIKIYGDLKRITKIHNSVREEFEKVSNFFNKAEIEELQEIS